MIVVGQVLVDRRTDDEGRGGDEQRVAVGRGLRDETRADRAARSGAVFDHHRLPPVIGDLLPMIRARTSDVPPGVNGTTKRTALLG